MNNFLSRFYFLSKFTTSLILLILLVILSFLFVKSYLKQNSPINSNIEINTLSDQITNLADIVEQNSNNLNAVKSLVIKNEESVENTSINFEALNDNLLLQADKITEENKKIKDELYNILLVIKNLQNIPPSLSQNNQSLTTIKNIVKLIRLKLDNGMSFNEEVGLLEDLELDVNYLSYVEKLSIYATKNFFGLEELNNSFDRISSNYLNDYYIKKNKNNFVKFFFNLVSIQPNLHEQVEDETVLLLSLVKQNLLNKHINESIKKLNELNDVEFYFLTWIKQARYYEQVINLLNKF